MTALGSTALIQWARLSQKDWNFSLYATEGITSPRFLIALPTKGSLISSQPSTKGLFLNLEATFFQKRVNLVLSLVPILQSWLKAWPTSQLKQYLPQPWVSQSCQLGSPDAFRFIFLPMGKGNVLYSSSSSANQVGIPSPQNFSPMMSWWQSIRVQMPFLPAKLIRFSMMSRQVSLYVSFWGSTPDHIMPSRMPLKPQRVQLAMSSMVNENSESYWSTRGWQGGTLTTTLGPWMRISLPYSSTNFLSLRAIEEASTAISSRTASLFASIINLFIIGSSATFCNCTPNCYLDCKKTKICLLF